MVVFLCEKISEKGGFFIGKIKDIEASEQSTKCLQPTVKSYCLNAKSKLFSLVLKIKLCKMKIVI